MNYTQQFQESMDEFKTFAENLKKGVENLASSGEVKLAQTEKELVYEDGKRKLYRYQARSKKICPVPMLIVYAMVNRYTMLDLQPDRSMIRNLLDQGQDVYLIDWGYADRMDRHLTMDDLINAFMDDCINHICEQHQIESVNLLGVCQGGTFSAIYSALHPEKVKNLITMVAPIDFATNDSLLYVWGKAMDVDLLIDAYGIVPGDLMNQSFQMLQPFTLTFQKYLNMVDTMADSETLAAFLRMESWIFDSPDQPGEVLRQNAKDLFQENKLVKGEFEIGGQRVDLQQISMPVLCIYADYDTLVPPVSSKKLLEYVGTKDKQELSYPVGHVGMFVSGKTQSTLAPRISEWLNQRI
ncbi:MAG: class III poly(R)-hydroxyalkanoic acid synthase subunit PhaC [Deltaproteobacteria bacterium]|jgi:polyhydroxyalkanoate synthase|nr:class III poly(R)-hydroxyalkanoic acid synthase subunit PhaC [Deltaproteobacteria bacterium]MBW2511450.1 class III poly(R)-hydroxyalkanoic acid synthase subunit PhaC [Deltaproteobacteria bacterium]MDH4007151.1 class III poly(R)-hydroxyalkanoic acid synthase subunit PhaC [Desulfuromonadales bacterium]HKJ28633.1 class III poly(R)-hydroxyalkanoic acid synthase subunit PhaC [Desulfuromonadales bacterium]